MFIKYILRVILFALDRYRIIFRFCCLTLFTTVLSGCVYIKSQDYIAAPTIFGVVKDLGKPVSGALIILEYTEDEKILETGAITKSTDSQGRFKIGPVRKRRNGLFIFGPTEIIVGYKLSIIMQGKTYLGVKSFGYWTNDEKISLVCELSRSAYPHLTHPESLATRCKSTKIPKIQ